MNVNVKSGRLLLTVNEEKGQISSLVVHQLGMHQLGMLNHTKMC